MKIDMNKDFETTFQNAVWKGMTLRELLTGGIAFVASAVIIVLIWHWTKLPINVCVYFGIPIMIPIVLVGIARYQGSSALELWKELRYLRNTRELAYEAEEYSEDYLPVFTMTSRRKKRPVKRGGK